MVKRRSKEWVEVPKYEAELEGTHGIKFLVAHMRGRYEGEDRALLFAKPEEVRDLVSVLIPFTKESAWEESR